MEKQITTICLCGNCGYFFVENNDTVRWYENIFCELSCLQEYFKKHASECHVCEAALDSPTEFSLKTASSILYFCSEKCLDWHKANEIVCSFCLKQLKMEAKPTPGSPIEVFCSSKCATKWIHSYSDPTNNALACVQCESVSSNHKIIYFGLKKQAFCVDNCFTVTEQSNMTKYGELSIDRSFLFDKSVKNI